MMNLVVVDSSLRYAVSRHFTEDILGQPFCQLCTEVVLHVYRLSMYIHHWYTMCVGVHVYV